METQVLAHDPLDLILEIPATYESVPDHHLWVVVLGSTCVGDCDRQEYILARIRFQRLGSCLWLEDHMKRLTILTLALLAGGACGSGSGNTQAAADTLTRAQKDNIIGNLPVPGASGVRGALSAVERAKARAEQHDTIS